MAICRGEKMEAEFLIANPHTSGRETCVVKGQTVNSLWATHSPYCYSSFLFLASLLGSFLLLSDVWLFATPWMIANQDPLSSTISWVCSDSLPMSWRCYPAISFSAAPVSVCSQSFSASGSFPMNHLFTSGGQNIRVSALASALPMNIQDWFPLGWTGLISLLSNGLSRVFSNTRFRKHYWFWVVQKQRGWIGPTGERLMTPSLNRPSDHLCVGCLFRNMIQRQTVS